MQKEHRLVMLSTKKAGVICLHSHNNELHYNGKPYGYTEQLDYLKPQHLYLLSDEQPKEGDWIVDYGFTHEYKIKQWIGKDAYAMDLQGKIIATTDESLGNVSYDGINKEMIPVHTPHFVPQIPKSFLPIYVKAYNEGNVIDTVEVEYGEGCACKNYYERVRCPNGYSTGICSKKDSSILKLTDNNEVIIKVEEEITSSEEMIERFYEPEEKMYSREELLELTMGNSIIVDWIKENLK